MMRDAKGLSAEQMNEFRASFNHFDRVSIIFYYYLFLYYCGDWSKYLYIILFKSPYDWSEHEFYIQQL